MKMSEWNGDNMDFEYASDEISSSMNNIDCALNVCAESNEHFAAVSGHKYYETQRNFFKLEQENDYIEF